MVTPEFSLIGGENNTTIDLGIYKPASIGNYVWFDINHDGLQDNAELPVASITVKLFDINNTLVSITSTDQNGKYVFNDLVPGDYRVEFSNLPTGFVESPLCPLCDPLKNSDGLLTPFTTLISGESDISWDLGIYQKGSLGDYVWNDADADGIQDATEEPMAGITVNLYNSSIILISTTTTDAAGNYKFVNLDSGDYYVEFTNLPANYVVSNANRGTDDELDSDATLNTSTNKIVTPITTILGGENDLSWDLGIHIPSIIKGTVWYDTDKSGTQNEAPLNGVNTVTVKLYDVNNFLVATTTTDVSGNYQFNNLGAGTYHVEFSNLPNNYWPSKSNIGVDDTKDSDGLVSQIITIGNGVTDDTLDLGIYENKNEPPATLGNRVWNDENSNGIQDAAEIGISGVTVKLYYKNEVGVDELAQIETTDNNGNYEFTNLKSGTYHIEFSDLPAGFIVSPIDQGADDTVDSDASLTGSVAIAAETDLAVGETDLSWDLGIYKPATLGDLVWNDINANGIQDNGETGVGAVTVKIFDSNNNLIDTQNTDPSGNYQFTNLKPGTYRVEFSNLPANYVATKSNIGGNDNKDSDGVIVSNIVLTSGDNIDNVDLGIYLGASLGDKVWNDINANGILDGTESGIENIMVKLFDSTGTLLTTATTDINGIYNFPNLLPGDYHVEFENIPNGYTPTSSNIGADDTIDSDVNLIAGKLTTAIIHLNAGENNQSVDFGLKSESGIGNLVWDDVNGNGIQDNGELGVANVTVKLFDSSNNLIDTKNTDTNGNYSFIGLIPGDYHVEFSNLPANYIATKTNTGTNDKIDSNGLVDAVTTLAPGEFDITHDLGIFKGATLGRYIWNDLNHDGIQDAGEPPLAGVLVNLFDSNGNLIATQVSDANGLYEFTGLPPGTYHTESPIPTPIRTYLTDTSPSTDKSIRTGDLWTDIDGNKTFSNGIDTLKSGIEVKIYDDLGNLVATTTTDANGHYEFTGLDPLKNYNVIIPVLTIGVVNTPYPNADPAKFDGLIWQDLNKNGFKNTDDKPLPNIVVNLYDETGNLIASTTTDANGEYHFSGLDPAKTYTAKAFNPIADFVESPLGVGTDNSKDSDGLVTANITLASGETNNTLGLGMYYPASVGNIVWFDTNENGIQDSGEAGVPNVTVKLFDKNNVLVSTMPTDSNGKYLFSDLEAGDYHIEFENLPVNYIKTKTKEGTDTKIDSDGTVTNVFTLAEGTLDLTYDLGIIKNNIPVPENPAFLGDMIWVDTDKDGVKDDNELLVSGVTVTLYDDKGVKVDEQVTNSEGKYKFVNLKPGTYTVEFTNLPAGYNATSTEIGGDNGKDSNGIKSKPIQLVAGAQDMTVDLGLVLGATDDITPLHLTGYPIIWWLLFGGGMISLAIYLLFRKFKMQKN